MSKIVRYSAEELRSIDLSDELKALAEMPDDTIDTSEVPEWTEEQFHRARARREERWKAEAAALEKKAS